MAEDSTAQRLPRAVPFGRALDWYAQAMRLFKRAPATFCGLGFLTIATEVLLGLVPDAGVLASKVVTPLVACGMLYAAAAADAGESPRLAHAVAAFRAPPAGIAAVLAASGLTFLAEWWAADAIAGVNLLRLGEAATELSLGPVLAIYAVGIVVSLPLTFVPFLALFEGSGMAASFSRSLRAFNLNAPALLVYGTLSYALLLAGLLTSGIGLVLAFPLWAASSYAAWKDVFERGATRPETA